MSDLGNEALKSAESTLVTVADAVLSGKPLRIFVPSQDDRNIVPDSRLTEPHVTEIVQALRGSKPGLKDYVNRHLFPVANHYRFVANYLQEKYDFNPDSDKYEEWRARLVDRRNQFLTSEYSQFKNVDDEACRVGGLETDPKLKDEDILAAVAELENKDILAAVAVIDSANQIADRLVPNDCVVSCDLDAIIQLAELHSFCDASFKFWDSEKTKEDGRHEGLSKGRQKGHEQARQARQEIKRKLSQLICGKNTSQYFHSHGKKVGKPKKNYILAVLQREFG